jgi:hypothetical protein
MSAIRTRVGRLEIAAGSAGTYSHEQALREMNVRAKERSEFCATASECELMEELRVIDAREAADIAELADPPAPPPEGTAWRWFHDIRYRRSPDDVREFHDTCDRAEIVAVLSERMGSAVPETMPTQRRLWGTEVVKVARAQLADDAAIADAIAAVLRARL